MSSLFRAELEARAVCRPMELAHLAVDILVTTAKVWIGFVLLLWIAQRFGITALTTALGKAAV